MMVLTERKLFLKSTKIQITHEFSTKVSFSVKLYTVCAWAIPLPGV